MEYFTLYFRFAAQCSLPMFLIGITILRKIGVVESLFYATYIWIP